MFNIFKRKTNYTVKLIESLHNFQNNSQAIHVQDFWGLMERFINSHTEQEYASYFSSHMEISPEIWLLNGLANTGADLLESGHYHIYRGVLNPQGEALRAYMYSVADLLCEKGIINSGSCASWKENLDNNIKNVG